MADGGGHRFGGDWTSRKLDILSDYLRAYTTALKNAPFEKVYIDAFAGTGYREARRRDDGRGTAVESLFPDLAEEEPQTLLDGSARRALVTEPRFDRYVFIEQSPARCAQLGELKHEFPELAERVEVRPGDANAEIRTLCEGDWRSRRAVLFLDPYGMQVEWTTIEAIAGTGAIDLWLLFPLGIGVNRLLTRSGEIPASWRRRLDLLLGTDEWYEAFYAVEPEPTLFDQAHDRVVKASTDAIGCYFNQRLKTVFAGVAEEPGVLRNSRNNPLYLLCFAVGNERARDIALRIATHLLREMR